MMRFDPGQLERQMWQRLRRFKAQEEHLKTRQAQLIGSSGFKGWLDRLSLSARAFVVQRQIRNHQQIISRLQR